jgi:hypothetical protein
VSDDGGNGGRAVGQVVVDVVQAVGDEDEKQRQDAQKNCCVEDRQHSQ